MSHPWCPNPVVWQQLSAGPLGAHIDTCAHQLLDQGYASWTAKDYGAPARRPQPLAPMTHAHGDGPQRSARRGLSAGPLSALSSPP